MIMITRDYDFFFYSRKCGAVTDRLGARIDAARARTIIEENPDGRVIGASPVTWEPGAYQWTFVAEVEDDGRK